MREDVHPCRIKIAEPGRARALLPGDEVLRRREKLAVDRLHALGVERTGVLDRLLADSSVGGIDRGVVAVARLALEHAARPELRAELRILGIVGIFRLLLGVEVIEIAEEFIE